MSCTGDLGQNASNLGQNIGLGILNFFGVGSFIQSASGWQTPLDNLKAQLKDIQTQTSQFQQQANIKLFGVLESIDENTFQLIKTQNDELTAMDKMIEEILKEEISLNLVYITFLYIFFMIIYLYIIFKK